MKILEDIEFFEPSDADLLAQLESMKVLPFAGESVPAGQFMFGRFNSTRGFLRSGRNPSDLVAWKNNVSSKQNFIQHY